MRDIDLESSAVIVRKIRNCAGSLDKLSILRENGGNIAFKSIMKFIYNPYFRTGISKAKLSRAPKYSGYVGPQTVNQMMAYLVDHNTGDIETCGIAKTWILSQEIPEARDLAWAVVTQDLQIGVSVTTLNKAYGKDFIPKISCMLGTPIDKVPESKQAWPYIVTEKLDGVRRLLVKQNGKVTLYSRSGHIDEGLVDIENEARYLPDNYVYDGELLAVGHFKDSIAQRQTTNSIANSKGERHGLTFNVFDMVPVGEFFSGFGQEPASIRKLRLAATLGDESAAPLAPEGFNYWEYLVANDDGHPKSFIKAVPILMVANSMEDIEPVVSMLWAHGKEGVMLNDARAVYQTKRTKQLVKMKQTHTYKLQVKGFVEGINKYEGMLGSLLTEYKGCWLQVGSGFSDAERWEIWQNQDAYDGMFFEVESFGESTNKQGITSLNCPIFKRFITRDSEKLFVD